MAVHTERRRAAHAPEDIFTLVSDVQDYPNFINFIKAMRVMKDDVNEGVGELTAEALIGYKMVREKFATHVAVDKPNLAIDVSFVSGPFKALENRWRFAPLSDGSALIEFWIDYQFKNPLLQTLLASNFNRAANTLISAFERRAAQRFDLVGDPEATLESLGAAAE